MWLEWRKICPGRADDANEVEAAVFEEALIFCRDDGVDQRRRNVVVADGAALFARGVEEIGDEFGLDVSGDEVVAPAERANRSDFLAGESDGDRVRGGEVRELRRDDVNAVAAHGKLAERVVIFFGAIADLRQVS